MRANSQTKVLLITPPDAQGDEKNAAIIADKDFQRP